MSLKLENRLSTLKLVAIDCKSSQNFLAFLFVATNASDDFDCCAAKRLTGFFTLRMQHQTAKKEKLVCSSQGKYFSAFQCRAA